MDTLEAVATVLTLWPKSFQPADKWRALLAEEIDRWDREDRSEIIDRLKRGHNGKRISIETLRRMRGEREQVPEQQGGKINHKLVEGWLEDQGLLDSYRRQQPGDRVMIARLIATMQQVIGWQAMLEEATGAASEYREWERVENLIRAAEGAMIPTRDGMGRKVCYANEAQGWVVPQNVGQVFLPARKTRVEREADLHGWATVRRIMERYGAGSGVRDLAAVFHDPEYQQYLVDYQNRTGRTPG
jgi:hypothetical protein